MRFITAWPLAALTGLILACSSYSTGPDTGNGNDGGHGGGPVGTVTVGNDFFQSGHNGTRNPAADTIPAGTTVTWNWTKTGSTRHSCESGGMARVSSCRVMRGTGSTE